MRISMHQNEGHNWIKLGEIISVKGYSFRFVIEKDKRACKVMMHAFFAVKQ